MTAGVLALIAVVLVAAAAIGYTWRSRLAWLQTLLPIAKRPRVLLQVRLWVTFVLAGTALDLLLVRAVAPFEESTLGYAASMWGASNDDSWGPMTYALTYLVQHPDGSVYDAVFIRDGVKFQYPLMSLLPLDALRRITGAEDAWDLVPVLTWASLGAFLALGIVCAVLWARAQVDSALPLREQLPWRSLTVLVPAGIASAAVFFPITRGVYLGQIQTLLTLGVAVALLAWQVDRKWVAGLAIGLCCMVKPQWAVLVLWAAIRRQWGFVLSSVTVGAVLLAAAVVVYGAGNVFGYAKVLALLGSSGESFFANQSVNGLANRALFNGPNVDWSSSEIAPSNPVVSIATTVTTAVILLLAVFWKTSRRPTAVDFSIVILSLTIAAPVAWEHHYGVVLPILAVALGAIVRWRPFGRWSIAALACAYLLTSQTFFPLVNLLADTHANVLQSYMFFGGVLLLVLLYRVSWKTRKNLDPAEARSAPSPAAVET